MKREQVNACSRFLRYQLLKSSKTNKNLDYGKNFSMPFVIMVSKL